MKTTDENGNLTPRARMLLAMVETNVTAIEAALHASIPRTTFSQIVNGHINPTLRQRAGIEAALGVPADSWPEV